MQNIFFFIVVAIVVVVKITRKMAEFNQSRPGSEDGWDEWEGGDSVRPTPPRHAPPTMPATPARPATAPRQPSERVRKILQQLQQMEQGPVTAQRTVPSVPPPLSKPITVAPAQPLTTARPATPPPAPPQRRADVAPAPALAETRAPGVGDVAELTMSDLGGIPTVEAGLGDAFLVVTGSAGRRTRGKRRRAIAINIGDRANVRRGFIMSEVLGQPRAFDI